MLDDYKLIEKIGCITIDNASNNVKFLEEFDILLENNGYQFSIQNKQIRCLCHVIQLVVNNFLEGLKSNPQPTEKFTEYRENAQRKSTKNSAEFENIVEKVRSVVRTIRSSPKQQEKWFSVCTQCNVEPKKLPIDCETRWSSAFNMLRRAYEYKTQISVYSTTCQKNRYCISVAEWAKVKKLLDFLKIFFFR